MEKVEPHCRKAWVDTLRLEVQDVNVKRCRTLRWEMKIELSHEQLGIYIRVTKN